MRARVNVLYGCYTEIAVDNYYFAKNALKEIEQKMDLEFCQANFHKAEHAIIITCVFSIMAIESFFNDFAAQHLGDDEFYENFDRLSIISKFQLISKFILNAEIDKSKSYYSNLKITERIRNEFVHNKSKDFFEWAKSINWVEIHSNNEKEMNEYEKTVKGYIDELAKDLKDAKRAIEAIRDVANFFDNADVSCQALKDLFSSFLADIVVGRNEKNTKEIKKEFKIK